jgi:hypothetical protein
VRCPSCKYDLRNLSENRCPECGREFDPNDPLSLGFRDPESASRFWTVSLILVIVLVVAIIVVQGLKLLST